MKIFIHRIKISLENQMFLRLFPHGLLTWLQFVFLSYVDLREIITSTIVSGIRISLGLSGIIIEYDEGSYRNNNILLRKYFISWSGHLMRKEKQQNRLDFFSRIQKLTIVSINLIATSRNVFIVRLNGFIVMVTFWW